MKQAKILAFGLSLAMALSAGVAGANTTVGANISTTGTLTVTGTSTLSLINGGTWNGTAIDVAHGGTGATDAATARTNLGLAIGTDVQAYNASLAAIAGGTWTGATSITDLGTITTGTWNGSLIDVAHGGTGTTSAALISTNNLSDLIDASVARTNLGLVIGTNVQAYDANLAAIAGGTWTGATSITDLGTITTGTWNGTAIDVLHGGTGATDAATARTNLGLGSIATHADTDFLSVSGGALGGGLTVSGMVGIGTTTPDRALVVDGNVLITGSLDAASIVFNGADINNVNNLSINNTLTVLGTSTLANVITTSVNGLALATSTDGFVVAGGDTPRTLTVTGGNVTLTGNAGGSIVTLPATGVLATLDGTETLTNKTIASPVITGTPTAAGATWADLGTVTTADINGGTIDGVDANFNSLVLPLSTTDHYEGSCAGTATGTVKIDTTAVATGTKIIWCDGSIWQSN